MICYCWRKWIHQILKVKQEDLLAAFSTRTNAIRKYKVSPLTFELFCAML